MDGGYTAQHNNGYTQQTPCQIKENSKCSYKDQEKDKGVYSLHSYPL